MRRQQRRIFCLEAMSDFLKTVAERVVIYDGAMGTSIQKHNLSVDDHWGKEGCSEIRVLSKADVIRGIHEGVLAVGAEVVETNSFGAPSIVLAEYELQLKVRE